MTPTWKTVQLDTVLVHDEGWHYDDDATITKLAASLQRHGQLRPLVVRGVVDDDSMCALVEGRKLLGAMMSIGWTQAMAVHLGEIDMDAALRVSWALELDFETNYARVVQVLAGLQARGVTAAELAAGGPLDAERIKHFPALAVLDWSQFGEDTAQARLDWDALEQPPVLALDTATGLVTVAETGEVASVAVAEHECDATNIAITPDGRRYCAHCGWNEPPVGMAAALEQARRDGVVEPLEDVTAPQPSPATPQAAPPAAAEQAAAPQAEAVAKPETPAKPRRAKAAKAAAAGASNTADQAAPPAAPAETPAAPAKPAKVPKAPDAQLGLF